MATKTKALLIGIILLGFQGCGNMDIHNPYEQSISKAVTPDQFTLNATRDNRQDDISWTNAALKWDLK